MLGRWVNRVSMSALKYDCTRNSKKVNSGSTNTDKASDMMEVMGNSHKLQKATA